MRPILLFCEHQTDEAWTHWRSPSARQQIAGLSTAQTKRAQTSIVILMRYNPCPYTRLYKLVFIIHQSSFLSGASLSLKSWLKPHTDIASPSSKPTSRALEALPGLIRDRRIEQLSIEILNYTQKTINLSPHSSLIWEKRADGSVLLPQTVPNLTHHVIYSLSNNPATEFHMFWIFWLSSILSTQPWMT